MFIMSEEVIPLPRCITRLSKYFLQSPRVLQRCLEASGDDESERGVGVWGFSPVMPAQFCFMYS